MQSARTTSTGMTFKTLLPFLLITFGLTWGLAALLLLFYDQIVQLFGEISASNPLFILAVYAPGIAAVLLVLWRYGLGGLGRFLQRLTLWRAPWAWWLFLIVGLPAIFYVGAAIKGTTDFALPFTSWQAALPALVFALVLGPIEELGWRGIALPLLQRRFAPFWAALILGLVWALWHVPAFLIGGTPQSAWSFAPYFGGVIAISIIMTPMFNAGRGGLLLPFLFHFQTNNPLWPDAQPWDNVLAIVIAVVVVWLNRATLFQRGSGATDILAHEGTAPGEALPARQRTPAAARTH